MPKQPASLRDRALSLLARREHSRFELTRKLEVAGFSQEEIQPVLDELKTRNWLSDKRFAESYVSDHKSKYGSVKLAYDLRQRGIDDSIIDACLATFLDNELAQAKNVWQKKFGNSPNSLSEKAKQTRYLQSRGFAPETIRTVMRNLEDDISG